LMSLYRPDSELVALNEGAGEGHQPVSAPTFEVLRAASHYASLSDGAFDITVKPLIDLWGFYRVEQAALPPQEKIEAVINLIGNAHMALDVPAQQVILDSETALDLGGIAKGYAVDRALAVLRARGAPAALVNLGGTIGVFGQAPEGRPWMVGIKHPREDRLIGRVRLMSGAVATSGDYDRYFEAEGKRYSHMLDPRTGWPVEGVYALTVVAPNATAADALSTAAFVLGPERGMTLLNQCAGVEGLIIVPSGQGATLGEDAEGLFVDMTVEAESPEGVSFLLEPEPSVIARRWQNSSGQVSIPGCVWPLSLE
jgi:FAD:protein FMN transferase